MKEVQKCRTDYTISSKKLNLYFKISGGYGYHTDTQNKANMGLIS